MNAEPGTREVACGHTEPEQPQDSALRGQREREIRIPETWPWAPQLATCIELGLTLDPPASSAVPTPHPEGTPTGPWNRRPPRTTAGEPALLTPRQQDHQGPSETNQPPR